MIKRFALKRIVLLKNIKHSQLSNISRKPYWWVLQMIAGEFSAKRWSLNKVCTFFLPKCINMHFNEWNVLELDFLSIVKVFASFLCILTLCAFVCESTKVASRLDFCVNDFLSAWCTGQCFVGGLYDLIFSSWHGKPPSLPRNWL